MFEHQPSLKACRRGRRRQLIRVLGTCVWQSSAYLRGVRKKSGPGVKSSNFSANIEPTETYHILNQWKLNKAFAELCRFEIAALIE